MPVVDSVPLMVVRSAKFRKTAPAVDGPETVKLLNVFWPVMFSPTLAVVFVKDTL